MKVVTVRLQKFLSERGVAARRKCADIIAAGRVTVDGEVVVEPGFRIDENRARVSVDGAVISSQREKTRTILLHKPAGYVCSRRGQGARTVYDLIQGVPENLSIAGRLDKESEGLLLLSSDGELVNRLTHPRFEKAKTYRVTIEGAVTPAALAELRKPIAIDGYLTQSARVRDEKPLPAKRVASAELAPPQAGPRRETILEFVLKEGRKRQIRRLCRRSKLRVVRLVRTHLGELELGDLKPGDWRDVTGEELSRLQKETAPSEDGAAL